MITTEVRTFQFENSQVSYRKYGCGSKVLLAFHGFGQTNAAFACMEAYCGELFTIFALDLFFHGSSHYVGDSILSKSTWNRLLDAFLQTHRIHRFSLMGFSLGGRFALTSVEHVADQLDQLILIAPDGITRNGWYRLATGSRLGRALFRYGLRHLSVLHWLGQSMIQIGMVNRSLLRFAELSLSTPEQRTLAYQSWTQFRLIRPDLKAIAHILHKSTIRVQFFTGAADRIVPGNYILPLTKRLRQYELTVLPTRHTRLVELAAEQLV